MVVVAPNVIGEIYFTHQRGKAMVRVSFRVPAAMSH